jgi:hypothetical protein
MLVAFVNLRANEKEARIAAVAALGDNEYPARC